MNCAKVDMLPDQSRLVLVLHRKMQIVMSLAVAIDVAVYKIIIVDRGEQ